MMTLEEEVAVSFTSWPFFFFSFPFARRFPFVPPYFPEQNFHG